MQSKPLNRDAIKYIAMLTMLMNHVAQIFMPSGALISELFLDIGYFTAPVMCYFLVEGFRYTRSKKRYAVRLAVFAVIAEIPYCLAFSEGSTVSFCGMNMLFTLLLCFGILLALERVQGMQKRNAIIFALIAMSTISDWALIAPLLTLFLALAGDSRREQALAFVKGGVLFWALNFLGGVGTVSVAANLLSSTGSVIGVALAGFTIMELYNGERMKGGRQFSKWFFYVFYPAHLLVLGLLRMCLL